MPTAERRRAATHWLLLLAVIAGILGMHILTSGNDAGPGHGAMPMPAASAHQTSDREPPAVAPVLGTPAAAAATAADPPAWLPATAVALPPMAGPGGMTACVLFLAVGGAVLILSALARRAASAGTEPAGAGGGLVGEFHRRGPPIPLSHLVLQVIRV